MSVYRFNVMFIMQLQDSCESTNTLFIELTFIQPNLIHSQQDNIICKGVKGQEYVFFCIFGML